MIRVVLLVSLVACGGSDTSRHILDSCSPGGSNSMALTGQASYVCHDPFKAKVTYTNNTCDPVVITGIKLSATTTSPGCTPPGDYTYQPNVTGTVMPGTTATVLDLTGNSFCCFNMACPATFDCDEDYTMTVLTAGGDLSQMESVHLTLGGCDTICP